MTVYRIDLVPLERFFFGGENTFGKDNIENYFVRSLHFPQQTTLLGMFRYFLLKQKKWTDDQGITKDLMDFNGEITNQKIANALIGEISFDIDNINSGFGIINKLSPVFISGPDGDYVVQSREFGLNWIVDEISEKQTQGLVPLRFRRLKGQSFLAGRKNFIPYVEGLNAKTIFPELLLNLRNNQMRYLDFSMGLQGNPMNGIFIAEEQIGINKKVKENGFYKQVGYRMLDGYGFSFYAETKEKINSVVNLLIKMGANQSWFRLSIKEKKNSDSTYELYEGKNPTVIFQYPNSPSSKIVLLSDTFIERAVFDKYIDFALADNNSFKYLQTNKVGLGEKFNNEKANFYLYKSVQNFELLKKGSVLFVEHTQKSAILKKLTGDNDISAAFHQIGYNYAI